MPHINKWSIVFTTDNPYQAPELRKIRLQGIVTGHYKITDGAFVTTSELTYLKVIGGVAHTKSGNEYTLGEVDSNFMEFIKENGYDIERYNFGNYTD